LISEVPNSNIEGNGAKAKFVPASLKIKQYTEAKCSGSTPPTSLTIVNTGTAAAELYVPGKGGGPAGSIPAGDRVAVCVYGAKKGEKGELFGLSNASGSKVYNAKLMVLPTSSSERNLHPHVQQAQQEH
jgi:hypothetical protein